MSNKIYKEGEYELFETTEGHQILHLNKKDWYALVEGQQGQIIVYSDDDHQKDHTLQEGHFYWADFEDDPEFKDVPHLFLEEGKKYKEYILPNGLPTAEDKQKKVIKTKERLSKEKVKSHLKSKGGNKNQSRQKKEGIAAKTKSALKEMAKEKGIPGRSKMNKAELIKHLK